MSDINIRNVRKSDYYDLMQALEALSYVGEANDLNKTKFEKTLKLRNGHIRTYTFVAVIDGKVVGTASVIIEPKFSHDFCGAAHVEDVSVNKLFQGKGVGGALVKHVIEFCEKVGSYKQTLMCSEENVSFYQKYDFYLNGLSMRRDSKKND